MTRPPTPETLAHRATPATVAAAAHAAPAVSAPVATSGAGSLVRSLEALGVEVAFGIPGITLPITKHNFLVQSPDEIPEIMAEAFHLASTGRPGPVLVDVPKDVLQEKTTFSWPPQMKLPGYRPTTRPHGKQIREAAKLMCSAKQPVLYVGGGVLKAEATAELLELAELTGIPVVTTLMARGAFPDSHQQHLGMPGMHGTVPAVIALQEADLLVALGSRFDDRVTGQLSTFAQHATV